MAVSDAELEFKESFLRFAVDHRTALTRIPPWMCDEMLREGDCPRLQFGLGVPFERFRAYSIKHGLLPPEAAEDDLSVVLCVGKIVNDISKRCKFRLSHEMIAHYRYTGMVALYSNFNKHLRHRSEQQDEKVIRSIKTELGLSPDSEAVWYWDADSSDTVTLQDFSIPKAVEMHMAITNTAHEDQTPQFESVDPQLKERYASFDNRPNMVRP